MVIKTFPSADFLYIMILSFSLVQMKEMRSLETDRPQVISYFLMPKWKLHSEKQSIKDPILKVKILELQLLYMN